jgi:hypothetical protein
MRTGTGIERAISASRDTGVVVRELFGAARESVYIAGFAVYNGRNALRALADNLAANPDLKCRMFQQHCTATSRHQTRRGTGCRFRCDIQGKRMAG